MKRENSDRKKGLAHHFEGWEPGALAVFLAGSVALVVVPRSATPEGLPDPVFDPRALARVASTDRARKVEAEAKPLDTDVRELGDAIRAFGEAAHEGEPKRLLATRREITQAAGRAMAFDVRQTLDLRSWETEAFLAGVRELEETGIESDDLRELGGDFVSTLGRNGWATTEEAVAPHPKRTEKKKAATVDEDEEAPPHRVRVLMNDDVLRAFFKKRWGELTSVRGGSFDLSKDELAVLYGFLLQHPVDGGDDPKAAPSSRPGRAAHAAQFKLKIIDEVKALEPDYPRELARGTVLYQVARFPLAAEAFRNELALHPNGPWALRAQNHLRATLVRAMEE